MRNTANPNLYASLAPPAGSQSAPSADAAKESRPSDWVNPDIEGRWVVFEYCISLVAITLRRNSRPIFVANDGGTWIHGLPYCIVSLLFGWWGVPWGLVYTPVTILANLMGGCDITAQIKVQASQAS
jgi:hypothetical protein